MNGVQNYKKNKNQFVINQNDLIQMYLCLRELFLHSTGGVRVKHLYQVLMMLLLLCDAQTVNNKQLWLQTRT